MGRGEGALLYLPVRKLLITAQQRDSTESDLLEWDSFFPSESHDATDEPKGESAVAEEPEHQSPPAADSSQQGAIPQHVFKEAKIFQWVKLQLVRRTKNQLCFEDLRALVPVGPVHIAPTGAVLSESSSHQEPCLYILGVQEMFDAEYRHDPKVKTTPLPLGPPVALLCFPLSQPIDSS